MSLDIVFYLLSAVAAISMLMALGTTDQQPVIGWLAVGVAGLQAIAWILIAGLYEEVVKMKERSIKVPLSSYNADMDRVMARLKLLEEMVRKGNK